jgi:hypothetical protein
MDFYETNIKNSQIYFDKYINPKLKTPLKIAEKESSQLMKVIGWFLAFFKINTLFMTKYITTLGSTIYFPKELIRTLSPKQFMEVIIHESVHALDDEKYKWFYKSTYLPELFFGLPLLITSMFCLVLKSYIAFIVCFILALIAILPIPKFGRYHWEMRAFSVSLFIANLTAAEEERKTQIKDWVKSRLIGSEYYFAMPFEYFYSNKMFETYQENLIIKNEIKKFFEEDLNS